LKLSWGIGILAVALISIAAALLGVVSPQGAFSMALLLAGLWTIVAAFAIVEGIDKTYYVGWGIIFACLSLSYFIPIQDALALILIAMVGLIIFTAYRGMTPKATVKPAAPATPSTGISSTLAS
jgi:hypothetical protein